MLVLFAIEACHERCLEDVVELEVLIKNPLFAKKEEMPRDFQSNWILGVPIPYLVLRWHFRLRVVHEKSEVQYLDVMVLAGLLGAQKKIEHCRPSKHNLS